MMMKKTQKVEQPTYRDYAFENAIKNKEKREAIVESDEPYPCPKCGISKHPSEFGAHYMENDLVGKYRRLYECKACKRVRAYEKRANVRSTIEGALVIIHRQIVQGAKQRGLDCDLTHGDIVDLREKQDGKCYYSASPMEFGYIGNTAGTYSEKVKYQISVDRKNNDIGYLKRNCVLCCTFINKMKGTLSEDEFYEVCKDIVRLHG